MYFCYFFLLVNDISNSKLTGIEKLEKVVENIYIVWFYRHIINKIIVSHSAGFKVFSIM